ncbi:ATP-binding protein [Campylobacter sp. RM9344]|uniref:ATP-binding protein n=1 Tax=Campylobacter californiensis TaxID=1032243 RepID=A0AAW3ZTJ5_9BACT|nr:MULTISPECIES: ATP-binding protein [unclassified Campylobacter]MBE2985101.1 ATP-binding protein [Campylobacter sp. RM6883]MBE2986566.1 ATP-binding protein [Campylobacter sp. RM12919]MBE2987639.1 ATP-binding protein [Campylobacter sp. RM12920]MBE2995574.1 ATP-binding protein [Campylobacter sp. RM6913]MBE3029264.1 ATP-binding protein [Campylobacter sp. RM9344]
MLLSFRAKNFRSFRDDLVVDMRALNIKGNEENKANINNTEILKSIVIFGANAAGKSNIVKAFNAMQSAVLHSSRTQRGDKVIGIDPFVLDNESRNNPTEFEISFLINEDKYIYGFSANKKEVLNEWLYYYPKGSRRVVFSREFNNDTNSYEWDKNNGKYLKVSSDDVNTYRKMTRENELFLSKIVQLNNKSAATCVFDWFNNKLKCAGIQGWNDGEIIATNMMLREEGKEQNKEEILDLLNKFDLAIDDIEVKEEILPEGVIDPFLKDLIRKHASAISPNTTPSNDEFRTIKTSFVRKTSSGEFKINIDDESDGTRKLYSLVAPFILALRSGTTVVIDELNNSLHTLILKQIVDIFHDKNTNKKNAQLIFTTHDGVILDQEIFRRDQVYFCSKDDDFASYLEQLSDYKTRDKEKVLKGYLMGRYGGIPNLASFFDKAEYGD